MHGVWPRRPAGRCDVLVSLRSQWWVTYLSTCAARFAREDASSRRVVVGGNAIRDVVGSDVDASSALDRCDLPGHRHRAREGRVIGHEVDCLDDANIGNEVDVPSLDDVRIRRRLASGAGGLVVRQHQSVGASGPGIEPLEPGSHSIGWEPRCEGVRIDEGGVDLRWRGGDDPRCRVRARHHRTVAPGRLTTAGAGCGEPAGRVRRAGRVRVESSRWHAYPALMPRGRRCPQCARYTFHASNGVSTDWARACTACGARGWLADDGDSAPGRGRICGSCDQAALKTYVRVGAVRLDYCNACDSVTMIDES